MFKHPEESNKIIPNEDITAVIVAALSHDVRYNYHDTEEHVIKGFKCRVSVEQYELKLLDSPEFGNQCRAI